MIKVSMDKTLILVPIVGKSGFASGNENIDGQEEEAMGTGGEDEWGGICQFFYREPPLHRKFFFLYFISN